jgi:16S rRNA processing protein RimM
MSKNEKGPQSEENVSDELLTIGQVTAPWGNKGEVKLFPLTDFPERFSDLAQVFWSKEGQQRELTIEKIRKHKDLFLVKFVSIDSTNEAEGLRQGYLRIPKEQRWPLPEGHYYLYEIIGLTVVTHEGERIGVVGDVLRTGSNDIYVVQREGNAQDLLLPALKTVVLHIDTQAKTMTVSIPDGLD